MLEQPEKTQARLRATLQRKGSPWIEVEDAGDLAAVQRFVGVKVHGEAAAAAAVHLQLDGLSTRGRCKGDGRSRTIVIQLLWMMGAGAG